jgi:ZIP family zinc transporter
LNGFAAGVMTAASIWSLLIPAIDRSEAMGFFAFLPATLGLWLGIAFFHGADLLSAGLSAESEKRRPSRLILAVTLHNLPEGMAVGVVYAAYLAAPSGEALGCAFALSLGIAIQNFPESAIISMPLRAEGRSRSASFLCGFASGLVEPIGAVLTLLAISVVLPVLPYLLGFAAGAMIYAVISELMPSFSRSESLIGVLSFSAGFCAMMMLDVAFG